MTIILQITIQQVKTHGGALFDALQLWSRTGEGGRVGGRGTGGRGTGGGDAGGRDGGGNSCVNMGLWEIGEGRHGTIPHSITTKLWDCHPSLQEAYVAKVPYTTNVT